MAALLCLRIPRQSLALPYFYNTFGILKYIAFIGCDTSIIFCIERPIHEMRKAPGQTSGGFVLCPLSAHHPVTIRLCSLGDERRAGHSPGAGLAVQPLQHALWEADVDAHRGLSISGASGSVHGFVLKLLLRHGLYLSPVSKKRKITDSPAVIEGVPSHGQAPVNLCLRRFEKTLDIDFHFHIDIVRS